MKKTFLLIAFLMLSLGSAFGADVWVEAEHFDKKGGWVVDQQFMDQMGSPYLLAHGMGRPVEAAVTTVDIPVADRYFVYVRTFNWTAPWFSGRGPGRFSVTVGKQCLATVLGDQGESWMWQLAGRVRVDKGKTTLSLNDLSGFDGRCDAIYLTTEKTPPPSEPKALADLRQQRLNPSGKAPAKATFDLVVVGGGIAGMCAAVAASRLGCRVALVNDRPVLGGNNSAEIRVHLGGCIEMEPNVGLGRMIREFGHAQQGNAQSAANYEDEKKAAFVAAEKGITLYAPFHAVAVRKERDKIASVTVQQIETGERVELDAPLFSDCTGDGSVGFMAGADFRMGRESREVFGESLAPAKADKSTMGVSVQWRSADTGKATTFPLFCYGLIFNEKNCERVTMGEWTWETGMNFDQIADAERIRDYGLLVVYSNWSFLKNGLAANEKFRTRELEWVAYVAGKRESRRLLGDYILTQKDLDNRTPHADDSFTTTWSIDLHFPDSINSVRFPGREFKAATRHVVIYPCAVPYRCLYSRNIENLFMAGRDISVTHVALGTVRVMRTTGMMGEVVGMAASLCKRYGVMPRGVYQAHLDELCAMMREGVGKKENLPDNQHFNEGGSRAKFRR